MKIKLKLNSFFWVLSFGSAIILLVFLVFQLNAITFEIGLIQEYENKLEIAKQDNENLTIDSAQINSLDIEVFGFEKVGRIHFIRPLEEIVVVK